MSFRSAVITFPGSNCDRDMADALEKVSGTAPHRVWHGDAALPDGLDFIALPGGFGTFEELCEILTWAQLGFHGKPAAILDVAGYYAPLLALCDRARDEGFVREVHRNLLLADTDPAALLKRMAAYEPPSVIKWVEKEGQL